MPKFIIFKQFQTNNYLCVKVTSNTNNSRKEHGKEKKRKEQKSLIKTKELPNNN